MPSEKGNQALNELETLLRQFNAGASVTDLVEASGLARRTVQRRLNTLLDAGRIRREGAGRATRYYGGRVVAFAGQAEATAKVSADLQRRIKLSADGSVLREKMSQPIQARAPVGYRRQFLDDYVPNETWYLDAALRQDLATRGRSEEIDAAAGTYLRKIIQRLVIDLSWNSSRLEGNTYSLLETERLLQEGEPAEGKAAEERQMILNHKAAIDLLADQAEEIGFNRYTICNLHAVLSDNLLGDPGAGGRLRQIGVTIGGSTFEPLNNPRVLEECFDLVLQKAAAVADPIEQAFFVMVHFPYLQPFQDVNKRTSRLAANIPLVRANLCPLSFIDVPREDYLEATLAVYELNRVEYLRDVFAWAYRRSCDRYVAVRQSLGEPDPIRLRYREQIKRIVAEIVRDQSEKRTAVRQIQEFSAENICAEDQARFVEIVETELRHLHDGNIARYGLRPSEYAAWQAIWKTGGGQSQ